MKETKFRAWLISEQKMYYQDTHKNDVCKFGFKGNTISMMRPAGVIKGINKQGQEEFILMQYIDMHDKDKRGTYEGDIVENNTLVTTPLQVVWITKYGRWMLMGIRYDTRKKFLEGIQGIRKRKIIGNIWENRELMAN